MNHRCIRHLQTLLKDLSWIIRCFFLQTFKTLEMAEHFPLKLSETCDDMSPDWPFQQSVVNGRGYLGAPRTGHGQRQLLQPGPSRAGSLQWQTTLVSSWIFTSGSLQWQTTLVSSWIFTSESLQWQTTLVNFWSFTPGSLQEQTTPLSS